MNIRGVLAIAILVSLGAAGQEVPKADVFFGYSFLRANQAQSIPAFTLNGGLLSVGVNFNNHIALEGEFGGYHNNNIEGKNLDTTSFSYLLGPRLSLGRSRTVDPYIHSLFGVNHATTSIAATSVLIPAPVPSGAAPSSNGRYEASQSNFGMAIGGGLDIKLNRYVIVRPIQLDYYMTRFETPSIVNPSGNTSNRNQHDLRYAAGIAINLGVERATPPAPPPPPPPITMKACPGGTSVPATQDCPRLNFPVSINVAPNEICPGASARVTASGNLPQGAMARWTLDGEPVSQNPSFEFGSAGRPARTYRIGLNVTAPGYNDAAAESSVTVRGYTPPTGSLAASPREIFVGEMATLASNFMPGQCGGPLGPVTLTATEGTIRGNQFDSSGVRFDPPGPAEQRKTVNIVARVSDPQGSATAEGSVVVKQRAAIGAQRLPDIVFLQGSDRINNCGKRVLLDDLKNRFEADPGGRVVFVGHIAASEVKATGLDLKRALNGAAVISAGQGVCTKFPPSQILVSAAGDADNGVDFQPYFCASSAAVAERPGQAVPQSEDAKYRRVEVWFVPSGGALPASAKNTQDAASLKVSTLACPR